MPRVKAISLDVGWTLAYPMDSMWTIFARLCCDAGVETTAAECEALMRSLWSSGQEHAQEQFRAGAAYADSDEAFIGMFAQMAHVIFAQRGLAERSAELSQQFFGAFWNEENWRAFPDTIETIQTLRARGIRVGVLSNAPSDLPRMLERMGILPLLDFTVVSAVEGMKKPDRRIFERTLERAGVAPDEALHVGDMFLEDILGANAAGVRALLIERGERSLFPSYRESAGRDLPAETVVQDLRAVLRLALM